MYMLQLKITQKKLKNSFMIITVPTGQNTKK